MAKATWIQQAEYCKALADMGLTDGKVCKCGGLQTPKVTPPPKVKR